MNRHRLGHRKNEVTKMLYTGTHTGTHQMEKVRKVVKKINIEGRKELLMVDITVTADESMVIVGSNAGGMVAIGGVTDIVDLVGISTAVEGVITEPFGLVVAATIDVK